MANKQFKDPIYGYIEIDSTIVTEIIDTPAFQRLKDIRQTSYTPLYPAACHNRYVHSLGVYYLGRIAFEAIKPQLKEKSEGTRICEQLDKMQKTFELACLLHDVGHAPFSHTGEDFFLAENNTLYENLKESVGEKSFSEDFDVLGTNKPAPHECMSCVVGLRVFPKYFGTEFDRSLFARCIIGMPIRFLEKSPELKPGMNDKERKATIRQLKEYNARKKENELLNCVINLLNSSIIDVDRLDYIIRDAQTIGFKNVQVDYIRLLKGMRIVSNHDAETDKDFLCIGYYKSALSVIESAVYAHDAEKKWIQGHPSILYETEILKDAMSFLTSLFKTQTDPTPLFCYEALTEEGKTLSMPIPLFSDEAKELAKTDALWSDAAKHLLVDKKLFAKDSTMNVDELVVMREYPLVLFADEDLLYLMKCFCKDGLGYEYFARNKRRFAAWKSEAEFRTLFQMRIGDDTTKMRALEKDVKELSKYCQNITGSPIVNEKILESLEREQKDNEEAKQKEEIDADSYKDIMAGIETKRYWANALKQISGEVNIEFEFLIVFQKKFSSSFKVEIGDIPISFSSSSKSVVALKDVVDVLKSSADKKSNLFHIFYKSSRDLGVEERKQIGDKIAEKLIEKTNYKK